MPQTLCISIDAAQRNYIKEKKLSPSLIFQQRINELMGLSPMCTLTELSNLNQKVEILVKRLQKVCDFMEEKGVLDEFLAKERK